MRWKYIAIALLLVAVLLSAAGYLFLRTRDFNRYKDVIARAAKDATGRELTLGGDVHLGLSFWPTLVVADVALANAPWGSQPEMIRIHRIEAQLSLLRLLGGNVDLKRITMLGTDLLLETDASGVGNWEFNPAEGSSQYNLWTFKQLEVGDIQIEDLRLLFHNGETGSKMRLTISSLNASKDDSKKVFTIDLEGEFNKQKVALSGQTGLISDLFARKQFPVDFSGQIASAAIKVRGVVSDMAELKGMDLEIHASGKNLAEVASIAGISFVNTDAFDVKGHVEGSAETLALKEAKGNFSIKGVEIDVDGSIGEILSLDDIDLQIKASGRNLAEVGPVIKQDLPETGPFTLGGRLSGSATALALENARGQATHRGLSLALSGGVQNLLSLSGLNLNAELSGRNLAEMGPVIKQDLPEIGPFTLSGRLTGSAKALALQDARGKASHRSLNLTLNGGVKDLLSLSGLNLNAELSGRNLAEMGPVIKQDLPEIGPFTLSGRLTGSATALALENARGQATHRGLSLTLSGGVQNLLSLSGLNLNAELSGRNLAEMGPVIKQDLPEIGPFTLSGRLTGSAKALALQDARGKASHRSLNLTLDGAVKDLLALRGLDLNVRCSGEELSDIGPWVGGKLPELGKFDIKGHLTGSAMLLELDGLSALVDQSDLNGSARMEFRKRPKITAVLQSALIDLTPLMKQEKTEAEKIAESLRRDRGLFSDEPLPFDGLEAVDADITLNARNIRSLDAKWEFGHLALKLTAADLSVEKLEAIYKGTKVAGSFFANPGSPPRVRTKFLVQGFDLGAFLREIRVSDKVKGLLDIAVDVNSRGNSTKALAGNLDGTVGAVMGKGYLSKYLDWLAQGLTQKVISIWGHQKNAGVIDCGVLEFDVKNGLAKSLSFALTSPASVLTGEGTINLGTEKIDFVLKPAPKHPSLFSLATNLQVTGTIQNPEVRPDYTSLLLKGARALGAFVVGPVGLLAPFINLGASQQHPCDITKIGEPELQAMPTK